MKRRILTIFLSALLCISLSIASFAADDVSLLRDDADLLSAEEEAEILDLLKDVSKKHEMDVAIITVDTIGDKSPMEFADDYYDENGFKEDGLVLLIGMETRDWYISTSGYGITAFTDAGIQFIGEQIVYDLGSEFYFDAFKTYVEYSDMFIEAAKEGAPYDSGNLPKLPYEFGINLVISLVVAFIISLIVTAIMKGKLKSVYNNDSADDYVKQGSLNVTTIRDIFLYTHITKTPRPKETSSSGSSTHTSSSGRTHGGGGGKF